MPLLVLLCILHNSPSWVLHPSMFIITVWANMKWKLEAWQKKCVQWWFRGVSIPTWEQVDRVGLKYLSCHECIKKLRAYYSFQASGLITSSKLSRFNSYKSTNTNVCGSLLEMFKPFAGVVYWLVWLIINPRYSLPKHTCVRMCMCMSLERG